MPYQKILLALAGLEEEESAISEAMRFKEMFNAELSVLHVNEPAAGKTHMMMDSPPLVKEEDIHEVFDRAGFSEEGQNVPIKIMESEHCAEVIAEATHGVDLVVMGHHHKNRFLRAISDSTDERVADLLNCPALVVPL